MSLINTNVNDSRRCRSPICDGDPERYQDVGGAVADTG